LGDLLGVLGFQSDFYLPSDVFASLAREVPDFRGLSYDTIGMRGLPVVTAKAASA
jgi:hypothetical protein